MNLTLPWPPSANTYWRHPTRGRLAGRHLISEKGRDYRAAVIRQVREQLGKIDPRTDLVAVTVEAFVPDRRKRDLGNLEKALMDSLTHAGVWVDDSQIDDLRIKRARNDKGELIIAGMVKVTIATAEQKKGGMNG
jgi:crossover junction endodeoxyribonuclease RusA